MTLQRTFSPVDDRLLVERTLADDVVIDAALERAAEAAAQNNRVTVTGAGVRDTDDLVRAIKDFAQPGSGIGLIVGSTEGRAVLGSSPFAACSSGAGLLVSSAPGASGSGRRSGHTRGTCGPKVRGCGSTRRPSVGCGPSWVGCEGP